MRDDDDDDDDDDEDDADDDDDDDEILGFAARRIHAYADPDKKQVGRTRTLAGKRRGLEGG